MSRRAKARHTRRFVSYNADNRHFCLAIQRQKFCYETKAKAELACKFAEGQQRAYYCESCCAYHTTHMPIRAYEKTNAREKDERLHNLIEKTVTGNTAETKIKHFKKERIETEKAKFANEENTVQRYIGRCMIQQMRNGAYFGNTTEEEFAKLINFDAPGAKQAFDKTMASSVRVERQLITLYMLYRLEGAQDGLAYDSMSEMINDSFMELTNNQQKHLSNFLLALYNAGVIYVEKNADDKRVYFLKVTMTADDLQSLPDDCSGYFKVD